MTNNAAVAAISALILAAGGCATYPAIHEDGVALMAQGRYEEGIAKLELAMKQAPGDFKIRTDLLRLRDQALNQLLNSAASDLGAGQFEGALATYQRVLKLDPVNERAKAGLTAVDRDRRHGEIVREARDVWSKGNGEGAWSRLQLVLRENPANQPARDLKRQIEEQRAKELASVPTLHSMYDGRPMNLDFREVPVRQIFEALSRESGVTFVFDKDVKPDLRATVVARQASFESAVDLVLMTNQLEKKIVNRQTVLVYPATTAKLHDYQDLVVKAFYLTYADVKQTQNLIKTVVKTKDMFVDEKMNLIVLRDTPDAIRMAEKLVAMHDLVAPEVMLDLEVLEVQRNKVIQMGVQWPNQLTLSPLPSSGTTTTLRDLTNVTANTTGATLASAILNLSSQPGIINLLANPRVRSQNHEKARILIGDKVPVITTTSTATGFASQSVSYLDVGLKLETEPTIYLQDEIAIRLSLEVSSITNTIQTASGVLTYQIGTRTAATMLRLKDGETQVLAGLINDQDRRTATGIPGLVDLPIAGRLFGSWKDDVEKTEIVLLVTPHLIRNMVLPDPTISEFLSGTEAVIRTPAMFTGRVEAADPVKVASVQLGGTAANLASGAVPLSAVVGGGASLYWNGPQEAKVGEQFTVALNLKATSALRSIPLQLGFDPSTLEVVEVKEGGYFKQGGGKSSFANNVDAAAGRIFIGASRSEGDGATGDADIVAVTFRAKIVQPKVEIKLITVTAIGASGVAANIAIPSPLVVAIGK